MIKQLFTMEGCMTLMGVNCLRPDAVAVFAATTVAPGILLPWLSAASDALLLGCAVARQGATTSSHPPTLPPTHPPTRPSCARHLWHPPPLPLPLLHTLARVDARKRCCLASAVLCRWGRLWLI